MCSNNSKFKVKCFNAFFKFWVNDISIPEKKKKQKTTLNIEFWVVSTHTIKIWDNLCGN